jgi:hypothetical protein
MPDDFPATEYKEMHKLVIRRNAKSPIDSTVMSQFLGGWNAVAHRFRATADHDEAFTKALGKEADAQAAKDTASVFESKHLQERELFGFFVTGFSVLESFAYSMFALCSMVDGQAFPMQTALDRRRVSLLTTQQQLLGNYANEQVVSVFQACLASREFQQWKEIRNTLAHRTSPPRLYRPIANSHPSSTGETKSWSVEWPDFGVSLDANTTPTRRIWLANKAKEFFDAANKFGGNHL